MTVYYCPVCARYSDRFPTEMKRDDHLVKVHPESPEALLLTERRRRGFAQTTELGKTTAAS